MDDSPPKRAPLPGYELPPADELTEEEYERRFRQTMARLGGRTLDLSTLFYALTEQVATSNAYLRVLTATLARLEAEAEGVSFEERFGAMHEQYLKNLRHERLIALDFLENMINSGS